MKAIKIQIKHWATGDVLFEYECDDNTLVKTIREANLREANLREANLREANLRGANLYGANLYGADLRGADLRGADLREADLCEADLREANLREANLREANLREANLRGANLYGAKNADLVQAQTYIVPEGSLIGWKKCRENIIVKLRIPEDAKRSNATGRKCRAEYAEVLEIIDLNDNRKKPKEAISKHDDTVKYHVGDIVKCHKWEENRWTECAGGIHFFITRIEAEKYE